MLRLVFFLIGLISASSKFTFLNGAHLMIGFQFQTEEYHLYMTRNASGNIVKIEGVAVETLDALSERLNFTYSFLNVKDTRLERQSDAQPGLAYYMSIGKCDLVIGQVVMTPRRSAVMDFAVGYTYTPVVFLIPMPELSDQALAAVFKPFQTTVWIGLLIAMPIIAVAIYFLIRQMFWMTLSDVAIDGQQNVVQQPGQILFQTFRILVNQAAYFPRMRTAVYFVVGSWCLGSLVIVCAYNSLLTSYVLGSTAHPLIDSVADLVENSNIHLAVDKGYTGDIFISEATQGINKVLGDKLRSNPKSRCVTRRECIDLVKSGSYAYLIGLPLTLSAIDEDYKETGKCHLAIARKTESVPGSFTWALPKKSPYTKPFTIGFMELHEVGLVDQWMKRELNKHKNIEFCLKEARKRQQRKVSNSQTQISLKNFAGPFYILIVGYLISFIFFVCENVYFRLCVCRKKLSKNNSQKIRNIDQKNDG